MNTTRKQTEVRAKLKMRRRHVLHWALGGRKNSSQNGQLPEKDVPLTESEWAVSEVLRGLNSYGITWLVEKVRQEPQRQVAGKSSAITGSTF